MMKTGMLAAALLTLSGLMASPLAAQEPAETEAVELTAQVIDISCKQVYNLSGEMHRECAQVCADKGIPLAFLAEDGIVYMPVTEAMPGEGANAQLRPYAEQTVTVRGKKVNRAGINTLIVESIEGQ